MKLVKIEESYINPDAVTIIRKADRNDQGYRTELQTQNGFQLFRLSPDEVRYVILFGELADRAPA